MDGLSFLYGTLPGRILLRPLTGRWLSEISGTLLDTRISRLLIPLFIRSNHIDVSEYDLTRIHSFNDFFCRPLREGRRSVDFTPSHLAAPCDGLLTVYPLQKNLVIPVKQSAFTLEGLLRDVALAKHYEGGTCLVFRLCVDHFHRYCYADSGVKSENRRIAGRFHTVRPIALAHRPVFTENTREYTLIRSACFGTIVQMEVGAMLVGRICNHEGAANVKRGAEKGMFQYGGSTIILLLEKDRVVIDPEIMCASSAGTETPVRMGQCVGIANTGARKSGSGHRKSQ